MSQSEKQTMFDQIMYITKPPNLFVRLPNPMRSANPPATEIE